MISPHRTRTFKSGRSVALLLPDEFGIAAGTKVTFEQRGELIVMRPVPERKDG